MCSNNQLTFLPPLPTQLQTLRCDHNQLISLPPLPATLLHLSSNNNSFIDRNDEESIPDFYARVCVWEQETSKKRMLEKTLRFKEELMMNRWHPTRLDALLDMGFDLDML